MQRKRWMAWMLSAAVAMTSIGQTGVLAADFTDEAVSVTETAESDEAVSESEEPEGTEEAAGTDEAAESESEDAGSEGSVTEEAAEIEAADTEEETAAEAEVTIETEAETKAETAPETETAESVSEETEEAALFTAGEEASAVGDGNYQYYYTYPLSGTGEVLLLPGYDRTFAMSCWVYDKDTGCGEAQDVEITSVTASASGTWDESGGEVSDNKADERVEITNNGDGTWNIHAKDDEEENPSYGWVTLTYEYTDLENDSTKSGEVTISINEDYYELQPSYPNDSNNMLTKGTMTISFSLWHDIAWKSSEYLEDFSVKINTDKENVYDTDLISAEVNGDGESMTVTSEGETGDTNILVTAYQDENEMASTWVRVNVTDGYYLIQPVSLTTGEGDDVQNVNPNLGEELDITPTLNLYNSSNSDGATVSGENYRIRLEGYDENAWKVKEGTEENLIPVLVRRGAWGTEVTLIAEQKSLDENGEAETDEDGNEIWDELTRRTYGFDELNYQIGLTPSYEDNEGNIRLFSGKNNALTLTLEQPEDTLDWPEDYDVSWSVEKVIDDETGETEELDESLVSFVLSDDNEAVTLTATESDDLEFNVKVTAQLTYEGETLTETATWVWVRNPLYEYDFPADEPGECDLLPGWTYTIDSTMNCHIENSTNPDGADVEVTIESLEISTWGNWDDDGNKVENKDLDVLTLDARDEGEGGWRVTAGKDYGWAKLALIYTSREDNETKRTEEIDFYVSGDRYSLEFTYPEDTDNMLKNSEMEIGTRLYHEWKDDDGEHSEFISDYDLEFWVDDDGNYSYDTDLLDVSISGEGETRSVLIQSREQNAYENVWLTAYMTDEDGESWEARSDYISVCVTNEYLVVLPVELTNDGNAVNPGYGETLDFDDYKVKVFERWTDEDGKAQEKDVTENYVLSLDEEEVDIEGSFKIGDEDDTNFPTLTRIGTEGDNLRIVVKEAQTDEDGKTVYNEVLDQWYWIDELDYEISFDHSYGDDGENSLLFGGTPLTLTAQTAENTREWPEDSSIKYTVEKVTGEGEENREMLSNAEGDAVTYTTDENGALVLAADSSAELDFNIVVTASLMYGEKEIISGETWLWARQPEYSYSLPTDVPGADTCLPGWTMDFVNSENPEESSVTCYICDPVYPEGETVAVTLKNIELTKQGTKWDEDGELINDEDANIFGLKTLAEGGWRLTANEGGSAYVEFTCVSAEDSNETYKIGTYIHVSDEVYYLNIILPDGQDCILPGESLTAQTKLRHIWQDEDGDHLEFIDSYNLEVPKEDGNPAYDTDVFEVTTSGKTGEVLVEAKNPGESNIWLMASVEIEDENGNKSYEEVASNYFYMYVPEQSYITVEPDEVQNPELGEELNLDGVVYAEEHYLDDNGDVCTRDMDDEVVLALEWDTETAVLERAEGVSEEEPMPVLVRKKTDETTIAVLVLSVDENGKATELTRREYTLNEVCGHSQTEEKVTAATCTKEGLKETVCTSCGKVLASETIPAKGHTPGAAATCTAAQTCTVCGTVLANAAGHSWGEWTTVSEATVSNPEVRSHTCSVCGEKATEEYGSKLTPTIKFNAKSLKLQKKQKTTAFKVTFANGDSVKSWKSSNTKIVKVTGKADGTCTIKAKNKTGKAKITVTLASGLKKTVKVTVQKGKVKTTSVKVATKKVSLKKGETHVIETTVAPITTQQKTTYKSSNKKIAAVNKNGKITAKKKGTCTITVKSGSKSVKIKVTVN